MKKKEKRESRLEPLPYVNQSFLTTTPVGFNQHGPNHSENVIYAIPFIFHHTKHT